MLRAFYLFCLAIWMAVPLAQAQPVDGGRAVVELISERDSARPGETFYAALKMKAGMSIGAMRAMPACRRRSWRWTIPM